MTNINHNAVATARRAVALARECIDSARREERRQRGEAYFVHREAEVVPLDATGERLGDCEPEFIAIKEMSGKALQEVVARLRHYHGERFSKVGISGGLDCFESFSTFMQYGWEQDYDPWCESWDLDFDAATFEPIEEAQS